MKYTALIFGLTLLFSACAPTPEPIDFGADACSHCKMNIVQRQFASELVSQKGKVFKFDAIECMVDYLNGNDTPDFALVLVKDYNAPENWLDAKKSYFLVSNKIPSPMGGFLSAYSTKEAATEMAGTKGGNVYNWDELKKLRQD